jgi:DNA repair exonuclease SbcCD nuclease subunit
MDSAPKVISRYDFLAYADIHHDEYKNGITLDDTIAIEDQITEYAINNDIKTVIFAGDWFRATNPTQYVIKAAEASWKRRSDARITTLAMPGNHDRETKSSTSRHAFAAANIFSYDLRMVGVIDTVRVEKLANVSCKMHVMFIPAGHNMDVGVIPTQPTVVVFHAMLSGSALAGGATARGIDPEELKKLGAAAIIGGDNHTPQDLSNILGCPSWYLGAPLQHNWGDRAQKRGFWHFAMVDGNIDARMICSKSPHFVRIKIVATTDIEVVCNIFSELNKELDGNPGIVDITLTGRRAGDINLDFIEKNVRDNKSFQIRELRLSVDRTFERVEIAPGMQVLETAEDKWSAYVAGGHGLNMNGLKPTMLAEMGKWAIQEARKVT